MPSSSRPPRARPGRPRFSRALLASLGIHASALGLGVVLGGFGTQVFSRTARPFEARLEAPPEAAPARETRTLPDPVLPELDEPQLVESPLWSEPDPVLEPAPPVVPATPLRWPAERPLVLGGPQVLSAPPLAESEPPLAEPAARGLDVTEPEVTQAAPVFAPAPDYPRRSVRAGEEGSVVLRLRLTRDGRVEDLEVLESSGHERLDQAARATLRTWRFAPRTVGGRAVPSEFVHRVTFQLERD